MKKLIAILLLIFVSTSKSQEFVRSVIPVGLVFAWEIQLGPDDHFWLTETNGVVSRVNPETAEKEIIYQAEDYTRSGENEILVDCNRKPAFGVLGLALHPDFANPDSSYLYFGYSYNAGTEEDTLTNFKIKRLKWDASSEEVVEATDMFTNIPTAHDHVGGRIITTKQNGNNYIYISVGDLSHWDASCYPNPEDSPSKFSQDVDRLNGKILRFNMDFTIPDDNPIPGNPMYTRGHRNPQGLAYNHNKDIIYDIEHGENTDDEVNYLEIGKNYGWPMIHGYHDDNYEGETDFANNYQPNPQISGDELVEPLHSFCTELLGGGPNACTIAPSDGIYYDSDAIPEWKNSLLVVTLKDGNLVDQGVWQLKLNEDGKSLAPSTAENPNPRQFFTEDKALNGRIRDIEISKDGKSIYLINNGGPSTTEPNIIVYTYDSVGSVFDSIENYIYPNPAENIINLGFDQFKSLEIVNLSGQIVLFKEFPGKTVNISKLSKGLYLVKLFYNNETKIVKLIKN